MLEVCNRKVQASTTLKEAHKVFKRVFDEYGARALQAESNENIDYKALCHAVRVLTEAKELLTTGSITFPLINCDLLLKIRLGQMAYKEIAEIIEQGMEELKIIQEHSKLPIEPDYEFQNEFVYNAYKQSILDNLDS